MSHLGFVCLALLAGGGPSQPAGSRLAVIRQAPEFVLTDQAENTLRLADLRGQVLLVGFIFTTCNGTCPATTHRMCGVQEELKRRGLCQPGKVRLLSITLDPSRDKPQVLEAYAHMYDADLASWSFLTGPPSQVTSVISAWDMWARPAANGQLDHPSRVFLVDKHGRIREIYNLGFLKPQWVADDMALLLQEKD